MHTKQMLLVCHENSPPESDTAPKGSYGQPQWHHGSKITWNLFSCQPIKGETLTFWSPYTLILDKMVSFSNVFYKTNKQKNLLFQISMKFLPVDSTDINQALIKTLTWYQTDDQLLSKPGMTQFTYISLLGASENTYEIFNYFILCINICFLFIYLFIYFHFTLFYLFICLFLFILFILFFLLFYFIFFLGGGGWVGGGGDTI